MKKTLTILAVLTLLVTPFAYYQIAHATIGGSSLIGWWTLDSNDIFGTSVTDYSGSGITGTTQSGPTVVSGRLAQALSFNGTTQYVSMTASPTAATNNFTLSAWVNPSVLPQNSTDTHPGIIALDGTGSTNGWGMAIGGRPDLGGPNPGSNLVAIYPGVAWLYSGYTFPSVNIWYHVVMVRNGGTTSFYVNGIVTANTFATTPAAPTSNFYIGNAPVDTANHLIGSVDDVRVYNRALSAAEVQQLYYQGQAKYGGSF